MIGKTLGHYRVIEQLGKGGMGEVYLAEDQSLERKVALKFLPDIFTGDSERMARFEREAKLLASLNHPNIAAIYGLEQADGKRFLVLEYVQGETLQSRISKGPFPAEDALAFCGQIVDALETAHESGIIHRDLKPANIMITADEKVKILDFGLAKALVDEQSDLNLSNSPTLSAAATQQGVILGTAGYMSPEQARGKSVDKRADIWAFGVVLYEMLTGSQLFKGETVSDTLAAVLTKEPELDRVPPKFRPLLRSCLVKDPKKRLREIGSSVALLEAASETELQPKPAKNARLAWIYAAIVTLIMILMAVPAFLYFQDNEAVHRGRYHIAVPPMSSEHGLAVSPDGRWIAFVATSPGSVDSLFLREIESFSRRKIDETEGASYPFWSPDSQSVGFFQRGRLKSVDISSESIRDICRAPYTLFGSCSWNGDGVIVFADERRLNRVSAEGGEPTAITTLDKSLEGALHRSPYFLPDGRHFLYSIWSSNAAQDTYIGSLDSESSEMLLPESRMATYVEPGYLLFQREDALFAVEFDVDNFKLSGEPFRIVGELLRNRWGDATFSVSQNGLLAYRGAADQTGSQFLWYDRDGNQLGKAGNPGHYTQGFHLSPDETQIASTGFDPATNGICVWLIECERNVDPSRLSIDAQCILPAWSPDGLQIAYSSSRKGNYGIFVKSLGGAGEEMHLVESPDSAYLKDWSRDGQYVAYGSANGLYAIALKGEKKTITIIESPFGLNTPAFSPDGKFVAFRSDESRTQQIYVLPFPPEGHQTRAISTNGGVQPRWRGDGKELYYIALDGKMMAVEINTDNAIKPGPPRELFDTGLIVHPDDYQYDVTDDGKRFVLLKPLVEENQTLIPVVTDWTSLLEK